MFDQPPGVSVPTGSVIGVLCLDEQPYEMPAQGGMYDPNLYPWKMVRETVPGASVDAILSADRTLAEPYVETAKYLQKSGAGLIVSNCGYTIAYDEDIRRNVSVPVATSSLLLLPLLSGLLRSGEKIGILTFDAVKLTRGHLEAACPGLDFETVVLGGLENTRSWRRVARQGHYDWDQMEADSLEVLDRMLALQPAVSFVIVECCALCSFMPTYRRRSGVPVFDIVSLANLFIGAMNAGIRLDVRGESVKKDQRAV